MGCCGVGAAVVVEILAVLSWLVTLLLLWGEPFMSCAIFGAMGSLIEPVTIVLVLLEGKGSFGGVELLL